MAALTAKTITEKRVRGAAVAVKTNVVYTRTVQATLVAGETAGTANLTGFIVPANTLVMGGTLKASTDQGATATFLVTVGNALHTANVLNAVTPVAMTTFVPFVTNTDTQVTLTTAAAATTAGVLEVSLVLCAIGAETQGRSTFTV